MKKLFLACATLLAVPAVYAVVDKHPKDDKKEHHKEHKELDVVAFWKKAVELFKKAGYGEGTAFGDHASHNLHRVETMHKAFGKTHEAPAAKSHKVLRKAQK